MTLVLRTATMAWSRATGLRSAAADDPLGPVDQDPDAARDAACDLTASGNVCNPPEPEPFEPPPEFTPPSGPSVGGGGGFGLGTLLVVLLVVALVLFLAWLVVAILRNRSPRESDEDEDELDVDLDEPVRRRVVDENRPPQTWRSAATEHRDAGRYRDAIRCEYRALVGDLARAGIVDEIPGRTSGEERVQLAELAPAVAADFDTSADLFDEAWFSEIEVGRADDERFVTASRAVLDAVLAGTGGRHDRGDR